MFCIKCGKEITGVQNFCQYCGEDILLVQAQYPSTESSTGAALLRKVMLHKKKLCIFGIVVALIVAYLFFFTSVFKSPEELLMDHVWYLEIDYSNVNADGQKLIFYSNGMMEKTWYERYATSVFGFGVWYAGSPKQEKWEVLDDNVLYWGGNYYKWEEEWYVSGSEFRIGAEGNANIYITYDRYGYTHVR